ncbi:hypothetical protein B2J88_07925 [Rhodococcus sp. SRB_17]|nr:hypothetical protein [Rhodococcus sp. SRB_17]
MPKDKRIFINLTVDMDRNPKYVDLTDGQKWLIAKAIMHCREFTTDGIIKLPVWTKMGTNRNRIAVESCGAIEINRPKKVAIVHDYSEHNQTRAEVEKARDAKIIAGQKGGKARAANLNHPAEGQAAAKAPAKAAAKQVLKQNEAEVEEEEEKELTKVSSSSHLGIAGDPEELPRGPAVPIDAWTIVRNVIPAEHSSATKTTLALEVSALLKQGTSEADVVSTLERWLGKPGLGPKVLPHLLSDVIRDRTAPPSSAITTHSGTPPGVGKPTIKALGYQQAGADLIRQMREGQAL